MVMEIFAWINIVELDQSLFQLLNAEWTNGLFDALLPIWRNKYFWIPVYMFIILFVMYNFGRKKAHWFLLCLFVTVGTADFTSSHLVKKTVQRVRPCNEPNLPQVRELTRCGSGYSFTSSHATNHFAISIFLLSTIGLGYRRIRWLLIFWAVSVAYAQVYVGVHYPLDVISGAILGSLIAKLFVWVYKKGEVQVAV